MNFRALQTPLFTVLLIFVFLYVFSALFGPIPFSVKSVTTTQTDLFSVDGEGEATAAPDTATFTVGVTQTAPTVEAAKDEVTSSINKITADLKGLGVKEDDIKTMNYSVYPNQNFEGGRNAITGYTANQDLQVKVEQVDLANRALDAATAGGANTVSGVTFTLDDEEITRLEHEARKKAIADAKDNAKSIADAAGVKLGRIVSVRENRGEQPPGPMYDRAQMGIGAGGEAATDLQPGENTVRVTVSLSYETL